MLGQWNVHRENNRMWFLPHSMQNSNLGLCKSKCERQNKQQQKIKDNNRRLFLSKSEKNFWNTTHTQTSNSKRERTWEWYIWLFFEIRTYVHEETIQKSIFKNYSVGTYIYNTFFNKELNLEYKRNSHKSILKSDNQKKNGQDIWTSISEERIYRWLR